MKIINKIKFHVYRNLYLILNEIAKKCYEKYWRLLNEDN